MSPFVLALICLVMAYPFFIIYVVATRYQVVMPNRALVVFGYQKVGNKEYRVITYQEGGKKGYRIITSGGCIVWPIIQRHGWLNLEVSGLTIKVNDVVTNDGRLLDVEAFTQVRIDKKQEALETAANMLLGKERSEIEYVAQRSLEGHVRGVCATLTQEQLRCERDCVSRAIHEVAVRDLENMGMDVVSFVISGMEFRGTEEEGAKCPACGKQARRRPTKKDKKGVRE